MTVWQKWRLAAYVATVLGCRMIGDVSSATLEGDRLVAERMLYGGALTRKEALRGRGVITVPAGAREKASGAAGEIIFLDVADDDRVKPAGGRANAGYVLLGRKNC